jgi:hypothetical protein
MGCRPRPGPGPGQRRLATRPPGGRTRVPRSVEELVEPDDDEHRVSDTGREGPSGDSCALTVEDLVEVTQGVISLLGVERLASSRVRTSSVAVDESRADRGEEHDFLNSFIASDLQTVADEVADGNLGAALASYLSFGRAPPTELSVSVVLPASG